MQTSKIFCRIEDYFDNWFTSPARNAAGRMSLYRIIYVLFYLWTLRKNHFADIALIPDGDWRGDESPLRIIEALDLLSHRPDVFFFQMLEVGLIAGLILLLIGFHSRTATLVVLLCGTTFYAFDNSFGKLAHGNAIYATYIPALMLFSNWDSNYSVAAILKRRQGIVVDPHDSSWRFIWPMRVMLILLSILFFSSGYLKLYGGTWFVKKDFIANLLLSRNAETSINGQLTFVNRINPLIASSSFLSRILQYTALFFEFSFPMALAHRHLAKIYIATALIFHSFNAIVLQVGFFGMLVFYSVFVDWQWVYDRFVGDGLQKRARDLPSLSRMTLTISSLAVAIGVALLWNQTLFPRNIFTLLPNPPLMKLVWAVVALLAGIVWLRAFQDLMSASYHATLPFFVRDSSTISTRAKANE